MLHVSSRFSRLTRFIFSYLYHMIQAYSSIVVEDNPLQLFRFQSLIRSSGLKSVSLPHGKVSFRASGINSYLERLRRALESDDARFNEDSSLISAVTYPRVTSNYRKPVARLIGRIIGVTTRSRISIVALEENLLALDIGGGRANEGLILCGRVIYEREVARLYVTRDYLFIRGI